MARTATASDTGGCRGSLAPPPLLRVAVAAAELVDAGASPWPSCGGAVADASVVLIGVGRTAPSRRSDQVQKTHLIGVLQPFQRSSHLAMLLLSLLSCRLGRWHRPPSLVWPPQPAPPGVWCDDVSALLTFLTHVRTLSERRNGTTAADAEDAVDDDDDEGLLLRCRRRRGQSPAARTERSRARTI